MPEQLFTDVYARGDCIIQFEVRRETYLARYRDKLYAVPGFGLLKNVRDHDSYGLRVAPLTDVLALTGTEEVL
jgi:hypothetical protein